MLCQLQALSRPASEPDVGLLTLPPERGGWPRWTVVLFKKVTAKDPEMLVAEL